MVPKREKVSDLRENARLQVIPVARITASPASGFGRGTVSGLISPGS